MKQKKDLISKIKLEDKKYNEYLDEKISSYNDTIEKRIKSINEFELPLTPMKNLENFGDEENIKSFVGKN